MYKGKKIAVVIPSKNEENNLPIVVKQIPTSIDEIIISVTSLIDTSWKVSEELNNSYPVKFVVQDKPGKGAAQKKAINSTDCEIIVLLDADGSTDPSEITDVLDMLIASNADLVKGSRYLALGGSDDLTAFRSFGNLILTRIGNFMYRQIYTDLAYGFVAYNRSSLIKLSATKTDNKFEIFNYGNGFEFETLVLSRMARSKMKIKEFPSYELKRIDGFSNLRAIRDGFRLLFTLLFERFKICKNTKLN
jgi:glycosyltransferase involved in cell wall biosynthesis